MTDRPAARQHSHSLPVSSEALQFALLSVTFHFNDGRIKLTIAHKVAGSILALRAALEAVVVEVTKDPEYIRQMDQTNERLLNVIRHVSKPSAAGLNMMATNQR